MLFIDNKGITDPRINLAIEEYALKHLDINESYLLFYINKNAIIIGKNQNTVEEINQDYVDEQGITVVRRLSGGGAVYHDLGNLNFSFITKDDGDSFHNFKKFTEPVVKALGKLGVQAELSGRNDIMAEGKTMMGVIEGDSVPRVFIPELVNYYKDGKFPFDRLVKFYEFEQINEAFEDSKKGTTIKPILKIAK